MGAFQIVYDDFTGGQYMGPKSTNQPKNTWIGDGILVNPKGELIPTGSLLAAQYQGPSGATIGGIVDHWIGNMAVRDKRYGWAFLRFDSSPFPNHLESKIVKYQLSDGTAFPTTPTTYTITGGEISTGDVAFSSYTSSFYFVKVVKSPGPAVSSWDIVQFNINTGAFTTNYSFPAGDIVEEVTNYKYRLVAHSPSNRKLYYSGTDKTTWNAATQYYEFDSGIYRVEPRTDDLLVFTFDGVYSVTGVLGASVNIQQIITATNMYEGMWLGSTINRAFYFMDELFTGPFGGRAYRLIGATIQQVATFQDSDYGLQQNGTFVCEEARVQCIAGGKLGYSFKRGMVYAETGQNIFTRVRATATPNFKGPDVRQHSLAAPAYLAPTEYVSYGCMDYDPTTSRPTFKAYRVLTGIDQPTKLDAVFTSGQDGYTPAGTPSQNATGTVELPEYWHQKPFTVKEAYIEYKNLASASISVKIEPTGVVDTGAINVALSESTTITQTTSSAQDWVMYRYHPNNAAKGFGAKPIITMTNTAIKRVILNCED